LLNLEMKTVTLLAIASIAFGQAPSPQVRPPRPPATQSPASQARPKSATPQHYSADQVREGEVRFGSQCGFCHGKDAAGGETGPDLTRAELVAQDSQGDKLAPVIHAGRPNAGMPAFPSLTQSELNAIVAFLHTQMDKFAELGGGRRSVEPSDLATGNAAAGRAYFEGAGKCASCPSPTGDLASISKKYQGLNLLRRILYPTGQGPAAPTARATFTLTSGQTVVAPVVAEDDFSVTVVDPLGARQTYQRSAVKVKVDDPLAAHFEQLGKYTDADMHNVYAYLETLK
jgi:cytochrome c oxidase cbb3-type subunit III